jgi:cobalt-zinc-cadmium efflux system protein
VTLHEHDHRAADRRSLTIALTLIVAVMAGELIAGLLAGSIALLADAGHMLTDAAAIVAGLVAARLASRPASGSWTFGLARAEVLSAQANGVTLLLAAVPIGIEGIRRLVNPVDVEGGVVVAVALAGIAINLVVSRVLAHGAHHSINVEGVFKHILTDVFAFAGTAVAGVVVLTTNYRRADPIASLVVVVLMVYTAFHLLAKTGRVLLEAAPEGLTPRVIVADLLADDRVASVHDVHVWLITSGFPALSAHVLVEASADCHAVRRDLEALLAHRYAIEHTTLQVDHAAEHLLSIEHRPPS